MSFQHPRNLKRKIAVIVVHTEHADRRDAQQFLYIFKYTYYYNTYDCIAAHIERIIKTASAVRVTALRYKK
jgi:hypothetical protein